MEPPLDQSAFDFWLGNWDCPFGGGHVTNTVTREFAGHVIVERTVIDTGQPSNGSSMSVYDPALELWRQTWVDESGNYWNFVGTRVDGDLSFATPGPVDADKVYRRMVFSDITPDSYHWRWESSPDGEAWNVDLEFDYTRRAEQVDA